MVFEMFSRSINMRFLRSYLTRRSFSSNTILKKTFVLERLAERSLLQVAGEDVAQFMQGLITNDITHLKMPFTSMYTLFLTTKGRIFLDAIIYRTEKDNSFLIECDAKAVDDLQKHLKIYRVRKKIDILNLKDEFKIWSVFNPTNFVLEQGNENHLVSQIGLQENQPILSMKNIHIYRDPRLVNLGLRIITPKNVTSNSLKKELNISPLMESQSKYRILRYTLGVGEGMDELPPTKSFPLEANCDYLHGISFQKGCYIGQELTARTQFTGIVRKRLMPIIFSAPLSDVDLNLPVTSTDITLTNVGKLRGYDSNVGIGLLRIEKALDVKLIKIGDTEGTPIKPFWWPIEAPKDKASISKLKAA